MKRLLLFVILFVVVCKLGLSQTTVNVSNAAQLQAALNNAVAGQTIVLADGAYAQSGGFSVPSGINGTALQPITLQGTANAILQANSVNSGYALYLAGNSYWVLKGFSVSTAQKGIMLDYSNFNVLDNITVSSIGMEGIHLRRYSSYNTIRGCSVNNTGQINTKYGEAIYVGSANSNWATYTNGNPDTCNYNIIYNNVFGGSITAENIDIKEGTTGGYIIGNTFNGSGVSSTTDATSWVEVKGNYYTVLNNTGSYTIQHGLRTSVVYTGWGNYNTFSGNACNVNVSGGYGVYIQTSSSNGTAANNTVCTSNTVLGTNSGITNITKTACPATPYVWTGITDNKWNTASNWSSNSIPPAGSNIVIPYVQRAPSLSSSDFSVNNLSINGGASLTVSKNFTIAGTPANCGTIEIAPQGALLSNTVPGGNVVLDASITAQRGWRIFANPFSTTQSFSTIATVNGITINTNPNASSSLADVRTFSNANNSWSNAGQTVNANVPYALFIRGLATEVNGAIYNSGPSSFTYKVNGTLNGNSVVINPASASNFIIVGNPFPAPVNSIALTAGASLPYYTYQIIQGNTALQQQTIAGSWVPVLASDNNTTIPVLGAVAFQPPNTTAFSINAASAINTSGTLQTNLFGNEHKEVFLMDVEKNNQFQDRVILTTNVLSSAAGTDKMDLAKFSNERVNLYTITADSVRLAVDSRNIWSDTIRIGLVADTGMHRFIFRQNNFSGNNSMLLYDRWADTLVAVTEGNNYTFKVTADTASIGENRFVLYFAGNKQNAVNTDMLTSSMPVTVLGNPVNNHTILLKVTETDKPLQAIMYDMDGKIVKMFGNIVQGINKLYTGPVNKGIYVLHISDGINVKTQRIFIN